METRWQLPSVQQLCHSSITMQQIIKTVDETFETVTAIETVTANGLIKKKLLTQLTKPRKIVNMLLQLYLHLVREVQ